MPSQSDPSGDEDAMSAASRALAESGEDGSLYLIHRLDRTVGGLMVLARNKKWAASLSAAAADGSLSKKYFAVAEGKAAGGEYRDYLFKDARTNKAYAVKTLRRGAKEAVLFATPLAEAEGKTLLLIELKTGRFHQIRAQLSARGNSLVGDKKYGSRDALSRVPALFSCSLTVEGVGQTKIKPPTSAYPWSLFSEELYRVD